MGGKVGMGRTNYFHNNRSDMIGKIIGAIGLIGITTVGALVVSPAAQYKTESIGYAPIEIVEYTDWVYDTIYILHTNMIDTVCKSRDTIFFPSIEDASTISNKPEFDIQNSIMFGNIVSGDFDYIYK